MQVNSRAAWSSQLGVHLWFPTAGPSWTVSASYKAATGLDEPIASTNHFFAQSARK